MSQRETMSQREILTSIALGGVFTVVMLVLGILDAFSLGSFLGVLVVGGLLSAGVNARIRRGEKPAKNESVKTQVTAEPSREGEPKQNENAVELTDRAEAKPDVTFEQLSEGAGDDVVEIAELEEAQAEDQTFAEPPPPPEEEDADGPPAAAG